MADQPVPLALIGAGRWGRAYIRTIGELPDAEIAVLCGSNPDSAGLVSRRTMVTADWRSALALDGIAGVIIATPPPLHAEMVLAALDAGVPVMVEKPLTLDVGEAEEIQRRTADTGVPVLVDHTLLFHPAYKAMKTMTRERGPIRRIESRGGNLGPFREDTPPMWDYGAHDVAMCLDLIGSLPASATARSVETVSTEEGDGQVFKLDLHFRDRQTAEITVGNGMREKQRQLAIFLGREILVFDDLADDPLIRYADQERLAAGEGEPLPVDSTLPLTAAVQTFIDGIRGISTEGFGVDLGVDVVRVLRDCDVALLSQQGQRGGA